VLERRDARVLVKTAFVRHPRWMLSHSRRTIEVLESYPVVRRLPDVVLWVVNTSGRTRSATSVMNRSSLHRSVVVHVEPESSHPLSPGRPGSSGEHVGVWQTVYSFQGISNELRRRARAAEGGQSRQTRSIIARPGLGTSRGVMESTFFGAHRRLRIDGPSGSGPPLSPASRRIAPPVRKPVDGWLLTDLDRRVRLARL